MGRSLAHLVELVGDLVKRKVGLVSLNDPIDTTTAQDRLVFNLFASLAEFERELIRERTHAGLSAARARGRVGGRPKGLSSQAQATAMAAETLYREKRLSVSSIAGKLHISKSTLYGYLRHRRVDIGPYNKPGQTRTQEAKTASNQLQSAIILLSLRVENNSKFVRGKKRVREDIERYLRDKYAATQGESGEYRLKVSYRSDEELDKTVQDLLQHIAFEADLRNCFSESDATLEASDHRNW
jgi:hypothetical protein